MRGTYDLLNARIIMDMFGKSPRAPRPSPAAVKVNQSQSVRARDDVLKRLAKVRRATIASELTPANVKRKQLGAGV
jgi:hypothetical protein